MIIFTIMIIDSVALGAQFSGGSKVAKECSFFFVSFSRVRRLFEGEGKSAFASLNGDILGVQGLGKRIAMSALMPWLLIIGNTI